MPTAIWKAIVMHEQLTGSDFDRLVTVVIPTLNEETALSKVLEELGSLGIRNILIVDGHSSDGTIEVAKKFDVSIIFQQGRGKTGALKTAINDVKTPYMLIMDGDYTYDASCIPRFLQNADSCDEVIGARVGNADSMNRLHKLGNKIITKCFNLLMKTKLSDVCSGMYMLSVELAREIDLETAGFDVEAEIAAQIATIGNITEVPVNYRARIGRQKLSTWRHGFSILKSIFMFSKLYNPGLFFSMLSGLLAIPAALMLFGSFLEWVYFDRISTPWLLTNLLILLVTTQIMCVGFVCQVLRKSELKTARRLRKIEKNSFLFIRKLIDNSLLNTDEYIHNEQARSKPGKF
jgi:dolichol-phosphate hexosyltransferase